MAAFKVFRFRHDLIICHNEILKGWMNKKSGSRISSWHENGVAAKDFSDGHISWHMSPAKMLIIEGN